MGELVDRTKLRVCADPANLPFSNDRSEGFENKIAELMAEHMGVPVAYTWYPQTLGFVRNTLNARLCDLVIGVVSPNEMVQNTNPYYRSTYVLAHRTADGSKFADLSSPAMRQAQIGVVAPTPVVDLLVEHGLLGQIHSYPLPADTRVDNPGRQMIERPRGARDRRRSALGPHCRLLGLPAARADNSGPPRERAAGATPRFSHFDGYSSQRAGLEARGQ